VCRADIDESFLVCPVCTTRLRQACVNCKAPLEPLWQVCPYCETPIESTTPIHFPPLEAPRSETGSE
jgi:RNA polymerase subunit RPABC4/transcription elongation factor Spt4